MATVTPVRQYQVLMTPLVDKDVYGDQIDVTKDVDLSDYIKDGGIGSIKQDVDNGDYDIGVFTYGDITIRGLNVDGRFNAEDDWRSIFPYTRDKTKVTVNFLDAEGNVSSSFKGIINEEATRQDFLKDEVKFKVVSEDSVIRKTKVTGGRVATGSTFSEAIEAILNVSDITSVLTFDVTKINVGLDLVIDDGSWFDNKTTKTALDALMVASSSVMVIEESVMIVRTRDENSGQVFNFYGHGDILERENILNIKNLNTGAQRAFNSIVINGTEVSDQTYIDLYGLRQKTIDLGFLTDETKKTQIGNRILDEFKVAKMELEIETTTEVAKGLGLFDLVAITFPYRRVPADDNPLPTYGLSRYGQAVYPFIYGNMKIRPVFAYKVIGFKEKPREFKTIVKLRNRGTTLSDGLFNSFRTAYGSAIYGENVYQFDSERLDPNRISVYGAGLYGTVLFRDN
jgi:hypothetical protein